MQSPGTPVARLFGSPRRQKNLAKIRVAALLGLIAGSNTLTAQVGSTGGALPFAAGEEFVYKARVGIFGSVGTAVMKVLGPLAFRGEQAYLLQFDYRGKVLLFGMENQTRSWLSLGSLGALRFEKREKSPLSSTHEEYDFNSAARRWVGFKGDSGLLVTSAPLDELSLIFFIRSLSLADSSLHSLDRHFMAGRNPVQVRVLRREQLAVPAGTFDAIAVEVRTPAADSTDHERVVLLHLSDDRLRIPLRIEKSVKTAGTLVLSLSCMSNTAQPGTAPSASCK